MPGRPAILASAQAQFPKSANRTVTVAAARAADSSLDAPLPNGPDGWSPVHRPATCTVVEALRDDGFTFVSLTTGGTARRHRDVQISALL